MTWNEFVSFFQFSHEDDNEINNLKIIFQGKKTVEPSLFTRFNVHFLQSIEVYEKKNTVFIYPNDFYFLASLLLFKSLQELNSGDSIGQVNPEEYYKVGNKYCIGKAVFIVDRITDDRNGKYVWFGFRTRKNGSPEWRGYLLNDKTPIFSRASQDAELSFSKAFDDEKIKIGNFGDGNILSRLQRNKNLRNNTVLIVGPVKKYVRLFKNCKVNGSPLSDFINIGYMDSNGNIKGICENAVNYHIIISSEPYLASSLINENKYPVDSVFFDTSDRNSTNGFMDDIDTICDKGIETVICVQENIAFNYEPLLIREYGFFQWKNKYLNNDVFSDENIDCSLKAFKYRNVKFVHLDDLGLSDVYYDLLKYKDEIIEMPPTAIYSYHSYLSTVKDELTKFCTLLRNEDAILEKMACLDKHNKAFNSIKKEIIGNHPLIESIGNAYSYIFDFVSRVNKKMDYIWSIIEPLREEEDKIALVVSDSTNVDDVNRYYCYKIASAGLKNILFDTMTISDYSLTSKHYKTAVFVGWFRKDIMKKALFSNNSDNNIILLYKCEAPWVMSAEKYWNEQSICNDFSKLNPEIDEKDDKTVLHYDLGFKTNVDEDLDEVSKKQSNILISGLLKENGDSEFIDAIPFTFADNSYAFYPPTKNLVSISGLLSGDFDAPESIQAQNILIGDVLLLRQNSSKDVIEEMAEQILTASNEADSISLSKCWRDSIEFCIQFEQISTQELINRIKKAGCKRHEATIRSWIIDDSMICPQNVEDLKYIAAALNDEILLENYVAIFEAAKKVKAARIKAGFRLSDELLSSPEINEILQNYLENGIMTVRNQNVFVKNIGMISILKVSNIGEIQEFPKSLCNVRRLD